MHVLSLDDSVIRSFEIGAVFSDQFDARINSLDFHRQEDYLVAHSLIFRYEYLLLGDG